MEGKIEISNVGEFVLSGKSLFTLFNKETGNYFTFKVTKIKEEKKSSAADIWFVSYFSGTENDADSSYTFFGTIFDNGVFRLSKKKDHLKDKQAVKVFTWFWELKESLPDQVKVFHEGRCGRCGRPLTTPKSIMSGYGPSCYKSIFNTTLK